MSENSHKVFPLKRIAAAIYDLLLLLGVWFASGSIAVWTVSYTHLTLPTTGSV